MNKLLIILLAVCLVSVHAFVKREAETPKPDNYLDSGAKLLDQSLKDTLAKMESTFNLENVQKAWTDFSEGVKKTFNDINTEINKPK